MTLPDYARFLKQFRWTQEQLRAVPPPTGPRFTLDGPDPGVASLARDQSHGP